MRKLLPTPRAGNPGSRPNKKGGKIPAEEISTSSPAAFPASHFPMPEREKERAMTATSGHRCFELYQNFGPAGLSVKMLGEYLLSKTDWYSSVCALTWKASATPFKRLLYQLVPRVRRTDGIEFGLWPLLKTPGASDGEGGVMEIRPGCDGHYKLRDQIAMLPTPHRNQSTGPGEHGTGGVNLQTAVHGKNRGLKLQPAFALWMMGFPEDWCDPDGE
jgi:hypothetical protein